MNVSKILANHSYIVPSGLHFIDIVRWNSLKVLYKRLLDLIPKDILGEDILVDDSEEYCGHAAETKK